MKRFHGRRLLVVGLGLLAAPVVAASIAYACTALATLSLNPSQGDPGATSNGVGRGFSATGEPVVVRLGGANGQALWSGRPDAGGSANISFQIPGNLTAGSYTIMATQNNLDGQPVPGSPARAELTVTGRPIVAPAPTAAAAPQQPGAPAAAPARQSNPSAAPAPAVGQPAPAGSVSPATAVDPVTGTALTPGSAPAVAPASAPAAAPVPAVGSDRSAATGGVAPRSAMVGQSSGSPALPLALVGAGLVLTLAATASVIAGRKRDAKALSLR
jgi:hypothetical protein